MKRRFALASIALAACVWMTGGDAATAQGPGQRRQIQTAPGATRPAARPCAGGTATDVYRVYSECNPRDRMWHVVTDQEFMCTNPDGSTYAQTVRVQDRATTDRCDDVPIDPNAPPRLRGVIGRDFPQVQFDDKATPIGIVTFRECISGFWRMVEYQAFRAQDGRLVIDRNRPTIGEPLEPCQPGEETQRADARMPGTTGQPALTLDPAGAARDARTALAAGPLLNLLAMATAMNAVNVTNNMLSPAQRIGAAERPESILDEIDEVMVIASGRIHAPARGFNAALQGLLNLIQGPRLHASQTPAAQVLFRSLGGSTGSILEMQVFKNGTGPVRLQGFDVVLEPLTGAGASRVTAELRRRAMTAAATVRMNGYCFEFVKTPPSAGALFRIAPPEVQKQFEPLRKVMAAARRAYKDGLLHPDSDAGEYFNSIRQWAIWSAEQRLDEQGFTQRFLEHSRKNVEAAGRPWTRELDGAIRALAPARWKDIAAVLRATRTGGGGD